MGMNPKDYDYIDEVVEEKIGSTANTGGSTTGGTVMAKLNAVLLQFISNWTSARAAKIDTIASGLGTTTNTGGSATGGTAMAKLNAILTQFTGTWTSARAALIDTINGKIGASADKNDTTVFGKLNLQGETYAAVIRKYAFMPRTIRSISAGTTGSEQLIVSATGKGVIVSLESNYASAATGASLRVVIDGVAMVTANIASANRGAIQMGMPYASSPVVPYMVYSPLPYVETNATTTIRVYLFEPIHFEKTLEVYANTTTKVVYGLYD